MITTPQFAAAPPLPVVPCEGSGNRGRSPFTLLLFSLSSRVSCSQLAHNWATFDLVTRCETEGLPETAGVATSQAARPKKRPRPKSTGKRARDEREHDSDASGASPPFASLYIYICVWFVTRGREGLWPNLRQHSLLL